jgi:RNA polymerase subunit RPABC4/transcription elongation factor Spt4
VDDHVRGLIMRGAPDAEIRRGAIESGMRPMGEDGLAKVLSGRTTLEEVTRVVYLPEDGMRVCTSCTGVVSKDFDYCPTCGTFVGENCERCRKRLDHLWRFCPGCGLENRARTGAHRPSDSRLMRVPPGVRKAS